MIQFYFNNIYPYNHIDVSGLFNNIWEKYVQMYKQRKSQISNHIITSTLPAQTIVCGEKLSDLIFSLSNRDNLRLAIAAFTKYPIENFISPELWDEDAAEWDYIFMDNSAMELYFAQRMQWILFSLPISAEYQKDMICIVHKHDPNRCLNVINWYGENNHFIIQTIDNLEDYQKAPLQELTEDIFYGYVCKMTKQFITNYQRLPVSYQRLLNNKFRIMHNGGNIFPVTIADIKHIRKCEGDDFDGLFEMRVLSGMGPRAYFMVVNSVLYLGDVGTKAESEGIEQTADIERAMLCIRQILDR